MMISEKAKELNIEISELAQAEKGIREYLNKVNQREKKLNPFYTSVDIEILVLRYLTSFLDKIKEMKSNMNVFPNMLEVQSIAFAQVLSEISTLDNALSYSSIEAKECKWCKKLFKDSDDFCSPECLEKYAEEYLKKQDLP